MSTSTRIILLTLTIYSSQLACAFDIHYIPATKKSDESSVIRDVLTDLRRLSDQKQLTAQHVSSTTTNAQQQAATATTNDELNEQPLLGTASDVHYASQVQHNLMQQLGLLPAAGAVYESMPIMPPGKRRLDSIDDDSDALSSTNRRAYPLSNYVDKNQLERRDLDVIVERDAMKGVIDSGHSQDEDSSQLALPTNSRAQAGKRLLRLEGRLLMAAQSGKLNRVKQRQQIQRRNQQQQQHQRQRNNNDRKYVARRNNNNGYSGRQSPQESRNNQGRSGASLERRSGRGDDESVDDDDDSSEDSGDDRSSAAYERRSGDDSFEREAARDFNSDAQDQDQRGASNDADGDSNAYGNNGSNGRQSGGRTAGNSIGRLRQAASAGRSKQNDFSSASNDDDSNANDDEDIDATSLALVGRTLFLPQQSVDSNNNELNLQVEQSENQKKYPHQVGNLNQVNELQGAAGHHHSHHHGHYYQHVEVPKKKAWKFGFKRGNHKHESKYWTSNQLTSGKLTSASS